MTSNTNHQKRIPSNQWWCGCEPTIKFNDESEFVRHMKDIHPSWSKSELEKLYV